MLPPRGNKTIGVAAEKEHQWRAQWDYAQFFFCCALYDGTKRQAKDEKKININKSAT